MPESVQLAVVRLASMVAWIRDHPAVSVDEIGTHFHRTRRQVRRDIEYLASVGDSLPGASFEVDWELYDSEQRVVLRSSLGTRAPLRLSELEAQALLIGLVAITPLLGPDLSAHVPRTALVVSALGALGAGDEHGVVEAIPAPASSDSTLSELREALTRGERVRFDYLSSQGITSHRLVDPWELEATATGWLLRGWCADARAPRTFALASMSCVQSAGPRLEEPRRVRDSTATWTLDVDREARWIADEYHGTIVSELENAGARITLPIWNDQWGLSLLIDIAPHLRAAQPDMREAAGTRARAILSVWNQENPT